MPVMVEPEKKGKKAKKPDKKKDAKHHKPRHIGGTEDKDFVHLVRLAGVVVDGSLTIPKALMKIKGIGPRIAEALVEPLGYGLDIKVGSLTEAQIADIEKKLENINTIVPSWMLNRRKDFSTGLDFHKLGPELDIINREDINREKKIKSYRGVRHILGLPSRGQRTRSSFRKGATLGVSRKKNVPQAQKQRGKAK